MSRYGFWIVPDGEARDTLQNVIRDLSKKYDGPIFTPHMTIHGVVESTDSEVVSAVAAAAKRISPFELEFGEVEFSTTYFQCIFIRIKTTANLFNTHLELRKSLGIRENPVFMPHASLLYSDMNMDERERAMKTLRIPKVSFAATEITVVRADTPDPATWDVVAKVPLGVGK